VVIQRVELLQSERHLDHMLKERLASLNKIEGPNRRLCGVRVLISNEFEDCEL
jgi:hypothetical protein